MEDKLRTVLYSKEFEQYYAALPARIQEKYRYAINILQTIYVVSVKFVKRIENTDFYELRVSVSSNEYRTLLFAVDATNFMESRTVILLNSFLKKGSNQYKKEIQKAYKIIKSLEDEQ